MAIRLKHLVARAGVFVSSNKVPIVSVAVLLILSGEFYHSDLAAIAYKSHFVAEGHLDVYSVIAERNPEYLVNVTYPPLIYWLFGVWIRIGHALFHLFGNLDQVDAWEGFRWIRARDAIWLRIVYLPFFVAIPFFVLRILRAIGLAALPKRQMVLFLLFQPITLFVTFMVGQFDVIPTALSVAGIAYALEGAIPMGMAVLAVGVLFKNFPVVFLLIVFVCYLLFGSSRRERIEALVGGALSALIVVAVLSTVYTEALRQSYLRFSQQGRTINGIAIDGSFAPVSAKYYAVVLLVVALLAVPTLVTSAPQTIRNGVIALRQGMTPEKLRQLVFFGCVAACGVVFFDRQWWIQYIQWTVPWFSGFLLYLSCRRQTTGHWIGFGLFNVAYFVTALAMFPDHNHCFKSVGHLGVGGVLVPWLPGWTPWVFVSVYCVIIAGLSLHAAWLTIGTARDDSPTDTISLAPTMTRWTVVAGVAYACFATCYWVVGSEVVSVIRRRLAG